MSKQEIKEELLALHIDQEKVKEIVDHLDDDLDYDMDSINGKLIIQPSENPFYDGPDIGDLEDAMG